MRTAVRAVMMLGRAAVSKGEVTNIEGVGMGHLVELLWHQRLPSLHCTEVAHGQEHHLVDHSTV